jgi:hypothetical protein
MYNEIIEQVILKLYLARVQFLKRTEVTSMQVCQCIGEKWKSPTPDILARGLFTSGSSRAVIGHLSFRGEGADLARNPNYGT